jgi:hypothetical protein
VDLLTRATILRALRALGDRLPEGSSVKLLLAGGAALVVLYEARHSTKDVDAFLLDPASTEALRRAASEVASDLGRLLLSKLGHDRDLVWGAVERHVVPGRELKAKYAFDDLWEAAHGPP